jgi:hypothetical protein
LKQVDADGSASDRGVASPAPGASTDDDPDHRKLARLVRALDRAAGGGSRFAAGTEAAASQAQLTRTPMLQTDTWRSAAPPRISPGPWWSRHPGVLLPQVTLVLGILALLCGALAVGTYSYHKAEVRLAETSRFLHQLRAGPVADAFARVRAAWQAEDARQDALLARLAAAAGSARARVRRDHQLFVLETVEEYGLQPDIEVVRQFVVRLATCVRAGSCDRDVATAQLGPALWEFRDQHLAYFQFEYAGIDLDPYLATIAPRLTPPHVRSPGR